MPNGDEGRLGPCQIRFLQGTSDLKAIIYTILTYLYSVYGVLDRRISILPKKVFKYGTTKDSITGLGLVVWSFRASFRGFEGSYFQGFRA